MSDRFTRDPQQVPQHTVHRELALIVREQMRAAVSKVRAGPRTADVPGEQEPGTVDDVEPTVRRIDGHPVR
jgi:hypothetical protein